MSEISPSAYGENDPVLKERLSKCRSLPEITEVIRQRALELGAEKDWINPEILHYENMQRPDDAATGTVSRVVKVAGRDQTFTAGSLLELEREIGAALQAAADGGGVQPRGSDGKFTSRREMNLAEKTELDLRFRRGELSAPEYLKQSGELEIAFNNFAKEKLGVDFEELAANQQMSDAWQQVTEQWLRSPEGEKWEGGQENLRRITEIIKANGLDDFPSIQTLNQVVNFMRSNKLVVPYEGATTKAITEANSVEEINAAARASLGMPPRNSNLWGGR